MRSWAGSHLATHRFSNRAAAEKFLSEQGFQLGKRGGWVKPDRTGRTFANVRELPDGKFEVHRRYSPAL